ncbi:MAG: hypothetical protein JSW54_05000, partial [Fidelibacterota bacterium]
MPIDVIREWFASHPVFSRYLIFLGIMVLSYLVLLILRQVIEKPLRKIIQRSATQLDDIMYREKIFHRLSYLVPV